MNKKIIKDLVELKMEIIEEISLHLPAGAKERIGRLEYDFMEALSEATKEYLEKTERPKEEKETVKKVNVE